MIKLPSIQLPWHHGIIDLGTLGGPTRGRAINASGIVTGSSWLSSPRHGAPVHAFRYADGAGMIDLGALPPGNVSDGQGINGGGTICGYSYVAEDGNTPQAFLANSALVLTNIGTGDDFSAAYDIKTRG
jgi:probable HAF family extracellular repeat protein